MHSILHIYSISFINKTSDLFNIKKITCYFYFIGIYIFNLLFGDTSSFDEKMKTDGIITNSLYYNLLNIDSHFIITLNNSCDRYEELINEIDKNLKNKKTFFIIKQHQ